MLKYLFRCPFGVSLQHKQSVCKMCYKNAISSLFLIDLTWDYIKYQNLVRLNGFTGLFRRPCSLTKFKYSINSCLTLWLSRWFQLYFGFTWDQTSSLAHILKTHFNLNHNVKEYNHFSINIKQVECLFLFFFPKSNFQFSLNVFIMSDHFWQQLSGFFLKNPDIHTYFGTVFVFVFFFNFLNFFEKGLYDGNS